ncbi:hypothetical protein V1527DRAFT_453233 [Lipomyces starkeyi]
MESEISEVLEILRGPLPSDSVLEFIVSEDGYKKIIEEREKSNRKYSVGTIPGLTKSHSIAVRAISTNTRARRLSTASWTKP